MKTYINLEISKSLIYNENKNKIGIYRWVNNINGKSYVGSSINLSKRLSIYFSKKAMINKLDTSSSIIYSALLKYGYAKFKLDILEYCNKETVIEREQHYMDILKPEYNIRAASKIGVKHSLETISLMSKHRGVNHQFYGKTHSCETRKIISETLKSIVRVRNKSRVVTIETILKMSLRCHRVKVLVFDLSNNLINVFPTITSVANHYNIGRKTVSRYLDKINLTIIIYSNQVKFFNNSYCIFKV